MKTEFAKAIEAGQYVLGKEVVVLCDGYLTLRQGNTYVITDETLLVTGNKIVSFTVNGITISAGPAANDFEFKHVLDKQRQDEAAMSSSNYYTDLLAQADDKIKHLKEQLDGALEINKQYEQQLKQCRDDLFNLRMENARLDLAAQRWEMFNSPVNREIADKLLKKLADEAVETN